MRRQLIKTLLLGMGLLFSNLATSAHTLRTEQKPLHKSSNADINSENASLMTVTSDSLSLTEEIIEVDTSSTERESLFPKASRSLVFSHFTWGAEIGCSIDLSGYDMSTFDADIIIGYKNKVIRTVGIGAGVHRSFGNGNNFIPVYVVFRSSFTSRPSLFFVNFKAGYSFNTIANSASYGDVSAALGLGINLAMSKKFHSHIIFSYAFRHFNKRHTSQFNLDTQNVNLANMTFGVNF